MLIGQGRVTVDGRPASMGQRIDLTAEVAIDGVRLPIDPELVSYLVYKPVGVVTTMADPQGRPTVVDLVPKEPVTKPVGRLDLHSEGLLIMTNDGYLADVCLHPRYQMPKTYHVLAAQRVRDADLQPLVEGVELDDGPARATSARTIDRSGDRTIVELVLTEGRKREVRRMFDAIEVDVDRLVRTAIGPVRDRSLAPGAFRELTLEETRSLLAFGKDTDDG